MVTEFFHPHRGGIETHVHALARQLEGVGIRAEVVTSFPGPSMVDEVTVHRLRTPLLPRLNVTFTTHAVEPFLKLLRSRRFDLVHCHLSIIGPGVSGAAFLAQRVGLPTVVTFHSILRGYEGAFRILDKMTAWTRLPITFSAVSSPVADQVSSLLGVESVPVLPAAIDPDGWRPLPPKARDGAFRVVSTMRLTKRKRPRVLIDVLQRVRSSLPRSLALDARIIGDGPERRSLDRMIEDRGLTEEVTLCGSLSHGELREVYRDTDAFVLPSIDESFGLAALEARASGLPVVVLAGTGPTSFIRHEREGLIADSDEGLATAILRLARDSGLRRRIVEHNRGVPPPLQWKTAIRQHMEVYDATRGAQA